MKLIFAFLLVGVSLNVFADEFRLPLSCVNAQGSLRISPHSRSANNAVLSIDKGVAESLKGQMGDLDDYASTFLSNKFQMGSVYKTQSDQFEFISDNVRVFSENGGIKLVLRQASANFYFHGLECQFEAE